MSDDDNLTLPSSAAGKDSQGNRKSIRISGWDFATWRTSSQHQLLRSTMIAIYVLDRAPDWDRLVEAFNDTYGRVYAASARSPELGYSVTGAIMRGTVPIPKLPNMAGYRVRETSDAALQRSDDGACCSRAATARPRGRLINDLPVLCDE